MNRRLTITLILLAAAPCSLWFALSQGSVHIGAAELWQALTRGPSRTPHLCVHSLRLPCALPVSRARCTVLRVPAWAAADIGFVRTYFEPVWAST